jgi:hypothetical protein
VRSSAAEYVTLDAASGTGGALSPLRAELMRGDLRPAYLAWLLAVAADDLDDDAEEPPVPAGLGERTAEQEAMVEFPPIDVDLVSAAKARRVALAAGLEVSGTVGVILRAKKRGHVEAARPLLQALRTAGLWLADDLIELAAREAGE